MIDLDYKPEIIGGYEFRKHKGALEIFDDDGNEAHYYPVDMFNELIHALYHFKSEGFDIKLTGEEFKNLVEGSRVAMYTGHCDFCKNCIGEENCHNLQSCWVNFDRYDFIKGYGLFRRRVLIRDDYTCLCCGNDNEDKLQVHHIRPFRDNLELATSVKNGVTLCEDCHKKYHKKYGWKGNQKTFSKFIKEMVD